MWGWHRESAGVVGLRDSHSREVAGGDSKNPDGGALVFSLDEWKIFLWRVRTPASHSWGAWVSAPCGGWCVMPSRDDRGSDGIEVGGESSQEPLIGRELELDVLRQHIARVVETRRGHVVLILGESGVGKSRLAAEAGTEARKRGLTLIPVRCLGRGAEPYASCQGSARGLSGSYSRPD